MRTPETLVRARPWAAAAAAAFLLIALIPAALSAGPALNNVVITAKSDVPGQFTYYYTAYSLNGTLVATTQSPYPGAGFELPSGGYLFTVSAVGNSGFMCKLCAVPAQSGSTASGSASSDIAIYPYRLASLYGYSVTQVNGPTAVTLDALNTTGYPTSAVGVTVRYANGTAAAGATVSAMVIGGWYFWWGTGSGINMSGTTDSSGRVTLVLPTAPAVVSAWMWIRVNATAGSRPPVVGLPGIGSVSSNGTTYWPVTYVGLAGSATWYPPATGVDVTLAYTQPTFWATPASGGVKASSTGAAVSSGNTAVPSSTQQSSSAEYYLPSQIPLASSGAGASSNPGGLLIGGQALSSGTAIAAGLVAAAAVVAGAAVALVVRKRSAAGSPA